MFEVGALKPIMQSPALGGVIEDDSVALLVALSEAKVRFVTGGSRKR